MPFLFYLWIACVFLHLSAAEDIHCNVTQDAGRTIYTISKFNQISCRYSWSNATDYTLANHFDRTDDLVVTKNDTTLITYKCMEEIKYRRDCIAEKKMPSAVICTTNCSGTTWPGLPLHGTHHHWIIVAVLIFLVVVLVLVLVVLARCQTSRKCAAENPDPHALL